MTAADGTRIRIAKITITAKVTAAAYAQLLTNAPADIAWLLGEIERRDLQIAQLAEALEVATGTGEVER